MIFFRFLSLLALMIITPTLYANSFDEAEFSLVDEQSKGQYFPEYLDELNTPKVIAKRKCSLDSSQCWTNVSNQSGRVLKTYGKSSTVTAVASGRYADIAYLLILHRYKCGKRDCTEQLLFNNRGDVNEFNFNLEKESNQLDIRIDRLGYLYELTNKGLNRYQSNGRYTRVAVPEDLVSGRIGFNRSGKISIIAVDKSGYIHWSDGNRWKRLDVTLTRTGDRNGIISIYPWKENIHYIAIYKYISAYHKGLYVVRYDSLNDSETGGWLFDSEKNNIGFDPSIYKREDGNIIVAARNTSKRKNAYFTFADQDIDSMTTSSPRCLGCSEKLVSFMAGTGLSSLSWDANSKVKSSGTTFTDIDYEISDSLYRSFNLEAKYDTTSLTLNYLTSEAKKRTAKEIDSINNSTARRLTERASDKLFAQIDFEGLLSPSSSLRLVTEFGKTGGIAKIKDRDGATSFQEFSTTRNRFAILAIKERGLFLGGDYVEFIMPTAIGFKNSSGSVVYSDVDPKFAIKTLRFVAGYDTLAYAKRYETNYNSFYIDGSMSFGAGYADISSETKRSASDASGGAKFDDIPIYATYGLDANIGYVWQKRLKSLKGLGYSLSLGYYGKYNVMRAGSDKDNPDPGSLRLLFEREDIMHGPFFKANIIF